MKRFFLILAATVVVAVAAALFWLDRQFEEPQAAWVPSVAGTVGATSILAVFAHPDDEQLITGLLIRAVDRDGAVSNMITATKGEAGTPLPQISRLEDLGIVRHAEALKNSYALDVSGHEVWDYPDSGLTDVDFDAVVARLQDRMVAWETDLVVTFWPESGFSDHPDHKMIGRAATQAVRRLVAEDPGNAPRAIAYVLAPRKVMRLLGGERGQAVADNQPDPTHAMPGEGWAKIRGWHIHASQRDYVQAAYGMPAWLLHRLYDKEFYYVVEVGSDL